MYRPQFSGQVTDPPDLVEAARKSLPPEAFDELMRETSGAPNKAQLIAKSEVVRGER